MSKLALALTLSCATLAGGCGPSVVLEAAGDGGSSGTGEGGSGGSTTVEVEPEAHRWWVVVHPSDAPLGPGVFLFDETSQAIEAHYDLPAQAYSPHGIAFDGASIWVSAYTQEAGGFLYEMDPASGAILSALPVPPAEGVAIAGPDLWVCSPEKFALVSKSGVVQSTLPVDASTVQDCAFDGTSLYYLENGSTDVVYRVDPVTGAITALNSNVSKANMSYALAFDGNRLAVIDETTIRRFDRDTGEEVSAGPFDVPGWITAITPAE